MQNRRIRFEKVRERDEETEDEAGASSPEETKNGDGFRFCARSCFLTYPRCPILPEHFVGATSFDRSLIKHCFGKQERHNDGQFHLHVWVQFSKKIDTINPRYFDISTIHAGEDVITTYHPNIKRKRGKGSLVQVWEYLCKNDGTRPMDLVGRTELHTTSANFRKVYGDRCQWLNYIASRSLNEPEYPIDLPDGSQIAVPDAANKLRHYWIHGKASSGKTLWLETKINAFRNYKISDEKYPYDDYDNEPIVVYDDVSPKATHLLSLANASDYPRPVPGTTRYHRRYIAARVLVTIIVCHNLDIDNYFVNEDPKTIEALKTRFIQINMNNI